MLCTLSIPIGNGSTVPQNTTPELAISDESMYGVLSPEILFSYLIRLFEDQHQLHETAQQQTENKQPDQIESTNVLAPEQQQ